MNNFWETNFKADLGGFYEFAYTVRTMENVSAPEALESCETDNEGLLAFYIEKASFMLTGKGRVWNPVI